ncbi:unnamed protein product [Pichia kudriavzevii]|uniref:Ammonia transport outward protein 2 n=1 Tax=Pichia kudriavzevii TaxID=4909 RepID=A0A099P6N8_PICKU|nr:hypothetical protein JL09_g192 [Pichia kudriavzevii]
MTLKSKSKSKKKHASSKPLESSNKMSKSSVEHHEHTSNKENDHISLHSRLTNIEHQIMGKVHTSDDGAYVILDNKKYPKSELLKAFGGFMNPGWAVPSEHKFGNPAPLGLSAFAYCTFVASLVNMQTRHVENDAVNVGAAMFYGGFIQFIAGLWEISLENAFGGLAFCSFGGYWMASASNHIPWFHIASSYTTEAEFKSGMGFFYLGWLLFTIILLACSIKSTILFFLLFVLVFMRLLLLTCWKFADSHACEFAAGVFGVLASLLAWYHAYAGIATPQNSYYVVNPTPMPVIGSKSKDMFDSDDFDQSSS